jgi:hypothetical protein
MLSLEYTLEYSDPSEGLYCSFTCIRAPTMSVCRWIFSLTFPVQGIQVRGQQQFSWSHLAMGFHRLLGTLASIIVFDLPKYTSREWWHSPNLWIGKLRCTDIEAH